MDFARIEPSYISKYGCRLIWSDSQNEDEKAIFLRNSDLEQLFDVLEKKSTDKIELEDQTSYIMINEENVEFQITNKKPLYVNPKVLKEKLQQYLVDHS